MTNRLIILGSGAAPGVPTISEGWVDCDPANPKNRRSRAGVYIEIDETHLLVDTSADLRTQMIDNNLHTVDGVLYTHAHADHVMGIDDLRALNYFTHVGLNIYGAEEHLAEIRQRFGYVFTDIPSKERTERPQLVSNVVEYGKAWQIGNIKIMPLEFSGHPVTTTGYVFNRGQVVLIPDYKFIPQQTLDYLQKIDVNVLIMLLTTIEESRYHAGIEIDKHYIEQICPKQVFFTHMGPECDYEQIRQICPKNVQPAFDNMVLEL
jgi:phosphoribosyl 1,2-cyclic phosphate phosphodiesterase